jgi:hypothetical protein
MKILSTVAAQLLFVRTALTSNRTRKFYFKYIGKAFVLYCGQELGI